MFYFQMPFLAGFFLHLVFVYTRISVLELRCLGGNCNGLIGADFPVSLIYLAFSDGGVILFSVFLGSFLWGLYGLGINYLLRKFLGE